MINAYTLNGVLHAGRLFDRGHSVHVGHSELHVKPGEYLMTDGNVIFVLGHHAARALAIPTPASDVAVQGLFDAAKAKGYGYGVAPTGFKAAYGSAGTVVFSWNRHVHADRYYVKDAKDIRIGDTNGLTLTLKTGAGNYSLTAVDEHGAESVAASIVLV